MPRITSALSVLDITDDSSSGMANNAWPIPSRLQFWFAIKFSQNEPCLVPHHHLPTHQLFCVSVADLRAAALHCGVTRRKTEEYVTRLQSIVRHVLRTAW